MAKETTTSFPSFEAFKALPDSEDAYVFPISHPEVKGCMRLLKMGHIVLTDGSMEITSRVAELSGLKHLNDLPVVEMNFVRQGNILQQQSYLPKPLHFAKGYHNIMYNEGQWEHNRFIGGGLHNTLTVSVEKNRFAQLFSGHSHEWDKLVDNITHQRPQLLHQPSLSFTPYMGAVIQALWNSPLTGSLKSLFLETKMMELMLLQWQQLGHTTRPAAMACNKSDIDKMHLAKEILLRDIHNPPSIEALAKLCGTNTFKLKQGFKAVFNDTVFGYFNAVRLEQACTLIRHTDKTMTAIALETGYANPQHFTRAFKNKFGITPKEVRK